MLEDITLEKVKTISNYTGPGSSVLYSADYIRSKCDRVTIKNNEENLGKIIHELNEIIDTAANNGKYTVCIGCDTLNKYNDVVIQVVVDKLKDAGYNVDYITLNSIYPNMSIKKSLTIKW